MRVLVVEDEKKLAGFLRQAMEEAGHAGDVAYDGVAGYEAARSGEYDLVVLDDMLPLLAGREVCARLRSEHVTTPVLMLTARAEVEDRVAGLDCGADDFLSKPFALDELMARVRALLRRRSPEHAITLSVEDLKLNVITREVRRADQLVELTAREYSLLEYLMRNAGHPVSRAMIAERVWGSDFDAESNVIDVYINYLRAKIDAGYPHRLIQTVRNVGYRLG